MSKLVLGHRGYPVKYPENTIASFIASLLYGLDGFELDVWLTRDDEVVVIHDQTTGRVGDKDLDVKDSTLEELRRVYLGMGQTIPTLREVYRATPSNIPIIVEIKDPDAVEETYALTIEYNRLKTTFFTSFKPEVLKRMREISREARLGINTASLEEFNRALSIAEEYMIEAVAIPIMAPLVIGWKTFNEAVKKVKDMNLKIFVWTPIGSDIDKILPLHEKLYAVYDAAIVNDAVKEGGLIKKLIAGMR